MPDKKQWLRLDLKMGYFQLKREYFKAIYYQPACLCVCVWYSDHVQLFKNPWASSHSPCESQQAQWKFWNMTAVLEICILSQ